MSVFTDSENRDWKIRRIVRNDIADLKQESNFDIGKAISSWEGLEGEVFDALGEKTVAACWHFCAEQAKERGLNEEKFGTIFDGDVLEAARQALLDELIFFSRHSTIGRLMADETNRRKFFRAVGTKTAEAVAKRLDQLISSDLPTNAPESSASTPAR